MITSETIQYAKNLAAKAGLPIGTPYNLNWRNGSGGIDCSGFVSAIARTLGVPGVSATDWTGSLFPKTQAVGQANHLPGDLVFFGNPQNVDSHVAIWLGGDSVIQSSTGGHGVNIGSLSGLSNYYSGLVNWRQLPGMTQAFSGAPSSIVTEPGTVPPDITIPGQGNPIVQVPAEPGVSSGATTGAQGGATITSGAGGSPQDVRLGTIGPFKVGIPSGLVLGLLGASLLLLGAILFVFGNKISNTVNMGPVGGVRTYGRMYHP